MRVWRHASVLLVVGFACSFELDLVDNSVPPAIGFEFTTSGADEASGTVMIPVVLSRPADIEVTVEFTLLQGNNATLGQDFNVTTGKITFAVGEARREIPVMIVPDGDETEMAETFGLALANASNARLDETRAIHSVRIADHILPRVTIGPGFTTSSEGAPSMLLVKLDKASEGESTVTVGVAAGAPFPASTNDYTIADNTTVTFLNGETQKLVAIGEKEDTLDEEDNETVTFTLKGASTNLVLGATKVMDHLIADNDDPPAVRFNNGSANVQENGLGETVNVSLSTASGRTVRVNYVRDAADTADDGDATVFGSPGTLTFDPGQTNKTIILSVNNDNVDEDNETVLVNLSNAVNATITTGVHTCNILDNDTSTVSFQNSSSTVDEDSSGGVALTVRLSTPSSKQVSVPFSINSGTNATDGSDFVIMTASPLVFDPGVTQLNINIDIPDNPPGNEQTERLILDLGTPTNAPLGSPSRYTLSITE